jgi:hypothetical protein
LIISCIALRGEGSNEITEEKTSGRAWEHEDKEREKHSRKNHSLFFALIIIKIIKSAGQGE